MKTSSKVQSNSLYTLSSSGSDSDNHKETQLTEKQNTYGELSPSSSDYELSSDDDIVFNRLKQKFGSGTIQPYTSPSVSKRPKIDEKNETSVSCRHKRASKDAMKTVMELNDENKPTTAIVAGQNNAAVTVVKDSKGSCNQLELDPVLLNHSFAATLLGNLQSNQIQYVIKEQPLKSCIFFPVNTLDDNDDCDTIKPHMLIVRTFAELASAIKKNDLKKHIVDQIPTSICGCRIILIIFGTENYLRQLKINENRMMKRVLASNICPQSDKRPLADNSTTISLDSVEIESALARFQFSGRFQYLIVENSEELARIVAQYAKGLSELPNKLLVNKNRERVNWFAEADGKDCVRVDANGNGLSRLWLQQIMQFSNVGLDTASAIISVYSSPKALIQAYDRCSSVQVAELLLQDIPVRRIQGPLSNVRRIGPELSKKMYAFFKEHRGSYDLE